MMNMYRMTDENRTCRVCTDCRFAINWSVLQMVIPLVMQLGQHLDCSLDSQSVWTSDHQWDCQLESVSDLS